MAAMITELKRVLDQVSREKGVEREVLIRTLEEAVKAAARKKATDARREAEIVAQDNEKQEQEAVKFKNVAVQQYNAEVAKETAIAEQAGPLSTAGERKKVVKAEAPFKKKLMNVRVLLPGMLGAPYFVCNKKSGVKDWADLKVQHQPQGAVGRRGGQRAIGTVVFHQG